MGGGPEVTTQKNILDPEMKAAYLGLLNQYQGLLPAQQAAATEAAGKFQTTGFAPQFSTSPDVITRGLAAQGTQGLAQQAAAQKAQIAQQFRGNPGAQMALQRQADMQARLQSNPILFQAFQQQQGREQLQNQARLQGTQAANQALIQQLGIRSSPLDALRGAIGTSAQGLQLTGIQQQIKD